MFKCCLIMPVYNGERDGHPEFLYEAIESVLMQSFPLFKFIIVDDGSEDGTNDIIRRYGGIDSRIELLRFEENYGVTHSLNAGIGWAKNYEPQYIFLQDSDDRSLPNRLEDQMAFMDKHPELDIAGCWFNIIDINGDVTLTINDLPRRPDRIYMQLINRGCSLGKAVIRWSAGQSVGWFDEINFPRVGEDYDFYLRLMREHKVGMVPKVCYDYRQTSAEYQNTISADREAHVAAIQKAQKLSQERGAQCRVA